jgi:serine protein kinase
VDLPIKDDELGQAIFTKKEDVCAMNEDPIKLMPLAMRSEFLKEINAILVDQTGEEDRNSLYKIRNEAPLNPRCKNFMNLLLKRYKGDWLKVVREHIVVVRKVHSETDRTGIGTFQPKDEKNQDSTELTGDMNFGQIGHFGKDSDPRAFNFDGEFCVANRGMCEFIEMLKLAKEFLYDLLGASQEHQIKPKKFAQVVIDEVIIAHTNNPEYEKLKTDKTMEALRDRTTKIDVPYQLRWSDEVKIYEKDYGPDCVKQHIMPHTLEVAAFWVILTRLEDDSSDDKLDKLDLRDKLKLYDGKSIPGWTEDSVKELQDKFPDEGMLKGMSPRYVQDKISNCLAKRKHYINVFHVMSEIKKGLDNSSLITDVEDRKRYSYCVELAIKELDDILKNEVQKALGADEKAIERVCNKYIDNLVAYVNDEKVEHPITKEMVDPDERLMRSIEEQCDIPEQGCDDFRRSIAGFIGTLSRRGKEFRWDSNPELKRALEKKVFSDIRDTIKIANLTKEAAELDPELQERIDAVKTREYVSSIFARGDSSD